MAGLGGEERLIVFLLVGLTLAAGLLLWWQGREAGSGLVWEGAGSARGENPGGAAGQHGAGGAGDTAGDPGGDPGEEAAAGTALPPDQTQTIVVHVAGAVVHPGVYSLPAGSRAVDALNAAGGATAAADPNAVNLARLLVDGERFYLPTREEVRSLGPGCTSWPETGATSGTAGAGGSPVGPGGGSGTGGGLPAAGGKINLNTATQAQLETLPGIGPTLAARIVQYRTLNGPFNAPEELLNVSGIGEKKFAELRDLVTTR